MKYKKIVNDDQYGIYSDMHERLTFDDHIANKDEIELLEILIDEYENRTIELPDHMNPVEVVEYLLQENDLTKSQLARELGLSRQLISDVLTYRRGLSKSTIVKLADRFKLDTSLLTSEYELKSNRGRQENATVT